MITMKQINEFILFFTFICIFSGCTTENAYGPRISAFSSALSDTSDGMKKAFSLAEDINRNEQIDAIVEKYSAGNHVGKPDLTPLFTNNALETRISLLNGLNTYAKQLAVLVSGTAQTDLATADNNLATSLKNVTADTVKAAGTTFSNTDDLAAGIATAANTIGNFIINKQINDTLPTVINDMQQHIENIVKLFDQDIGDPNNSGLRNIINKRVQNDIKWRDGLIFHHKV
jgi:hypothetical protein